MAWVSVNSPATFERNKNHEVDIFRSSVIFDRVKMGTGDLILFALLVGCDYAPVISPAPCKRLNCGGSSTFI